MFTQWNNGRSAIAVAALLLAVGTLAMATNAQAQAVNVSVTEEDFVFQEDSQITVEVTMDNVQALAGVDVVLDYPADRFGGAPAWENGGLFGFISVNPAETPPGEPTGVVSIAAANSVGLGVQGGVLLRLTFDVPCAGNDVPGGQDLTFTFSEFLAYDESSSPLTAEALAATINLECDPVATDQTSFGTLKAFFD